jgi:hypothetical protein
VFVATIATAAAIALPNLRPRAIVSILGSDDAVREL